MSSIIQNRNQNSPEVQGNFILHLEATGKHGFDAPHLSVLKLIEEKSDQELR